MGDKGYCEHFDSLRRREQEISRRNVRDKLHELNQHLSGLEDEGCAERRVSDLKCVESALTRCESTGGSDCGPFFSHAERLIGACKSGYCC